MTDAAVGRTASGRPDSAPVAPPEPIDPGGEPRPGPDEDEVSTVGLRRAIWGITTIVFLLAALILLVGRRYGYAEVTFAVAVAAAINLF